MAAPTPLLRRRQLLRGATVGATMLGFSRLWWPGLSHAADLSLADRVRLLYSTQFHFTDRGEPQISIGIVQSVDRIELSAAEGLAILPSGSGGTTITGGSRFVIDLIKGTPADQRFAVVLADLSGTDPRAIDDATTRWRDLGIEPSLHELGAIFGIAGKVLDTRRTLILSDAVATEREASARARRLSSQHRADGKLHPVMNKPGHGTLRARDPGRGMEVTAEGVLWFANPSGGSIHVHGRFGDESSHAKNRETSREYRGGIYVAIDGRGKLSVVNVVSASQLLAGLVPAEIYPSAPMAALQAQAIAARGQLLAKVGTRHLGDPYLLCAHQHCQVYAGRMREDARTTTAVEQTAGWVAMRPGGHQLVDTVYSANSGGHTEDNDLIWPSSPDPQLRGRADPLLAAAYADGITAANIESWLRTRPRTYSSPEEQHMAAYRWSETIEPTAFVGAPGVPTTIGAIRDLAVITRGRSGRATKIRIEGEQGHVTIDGELQIRRALGGLRSSMFVVEPRQTSTSPFVLHGGGHGHGVGLCQHGAIGMARAGKSHDQILAHYYGGSKLARLW